MFDTHVHTKYSGDSDTEPPLLIERAKKLGLSGLIFTDHHDMDMVYESDLMLLNIPAYIQAVNELKAEYDTDDFTLLCGIEMGLQPHLKDTISEILMNYPFDYCIGSVHSIHGHDPYFDDFFDGHNISDRYHEFFDYTLKNVSEIDDFDSLGHLDYVIRYGDDYCYRKGLEITELNESELIEEILKVLIKKEKSLEVNTGFFRYGKKVPNPSYEVIKTYYKLGGRMITLGSDCHHPDYLGLKFDEVKDALKTIGFKSQIVYKKRTPCEYPL